MREKIVHIILTEDDYSKAIDAILALFDEEKKELEEQNRLLKAEVDVERNADWKGYAKNLEAKLKKAKVALVEILEHAEYCDNSCGDIEELAEEALKELE